MAAVTLVSVLLVSGVVCGGDHENSRGSATRDLLHLDFLYPGRRPRQDLSRGEREDEDVPGSRFRHTMLPVLIPIRYGLRNHNKLERSLTQEDPISPRLVMDKDFNIKFDNPYIMPLTKPLAFILNSDVNAREGRTVGEEKMMIPFPVLVKEQERSRTGDCRDDDVVEHRGNYEDDDAFLDDNPPIHQRRVVPRFQYSRNGTTTFHKTNSPSSQEIVYSNRGNSYTDSSRFKSNSPYRSQENNYNSAPQEYPSLDVYPSKIFADMYRTIPKHALDSEESQETENYHEYDKRRHVEDLKLKFKGKNKHPYRGPAFSASTDLHWVTHANSTKAKTKDSSEKAKKIVIYEVTEVPEPRTTLATTTSTTSRPISDEVWGNKIL